MWMHILPSLSSNVLITPMFNVYICNQIYVESLTRCFKMDTHPDEIKDEKIGVLNIKKEKISRT